jgi:hypothetical protein
VAAAGEKVISPILMITPGPFISIIFCPEAFAWKKFPSINIAWLLRFKEKVPVLEGRLMLRSP